MPPPPEPIAAPRGQSPLAGIATTLGAIALAIADVGVVAFPGPAGPKGDTGAQGQQGPLGANGTNCWDLNENGVKDPATEDLNGDTVVDIRDCTGLQGPAGPQEPQGDSGPAGPQGPPGPGAMIATATTTTPTTIDAACVQYAGAEVTIATSGPGTVFVTATVHINFDHVAAEGDYVRLFLSPTSGSCATDEWRVRWSMPSNAPAGTYYETFLIQEPFNVAAAGTYTYYVNGDMVGGTGGADSVVGAALTAIFYAT